MISYSDRVVLSGTEDCRVYVLPTSAADIVTFRGSFRTRPDLRANEDLIQELVVAALDKGTTAHDKREIAETLDNLGAQIDFYSDGMRAGFRGRALSKDVEKVLDLVAEQLRHPLLKAEEVEVARTRLIASAKRSLESTGDQSSGALRRNVFPVDHPNHVMPPQEVIRLYEAMEIDQVRSYHAAHFGAADLNTVFVGDVDTTRVAEAVTTVFADWVASDLPDSFAQGHVAPAPGASFVSMPDKPNGDVSMGHGLDLRRQDSRFIPLFVANYVLGGNFSARLMAKVRDQLGLTYGIRSSIPNVDIEYDGLWEVSVTLSTENLERGIEATRRELETFVESGITQEELEEKKTTITGSFKVGLSTTAGLARTLLANVERGFGPGYLDRFPIEVGECRLQDCNDAVTSLLDPSRMHIAVAGGRRPAVASHDISA